MREFLRAVAIVALALVGGVGSGCFSRKEKAERPPSAFTVKTSGTTTNLAPVPVPVSVGRVASVNAPAKFAVINFPIGQVPANNTRLAIFHAGTKAGEVRITGPAQDTFTVGDIISGTAQEGDEVRAE